MKRSLRDRALTMRIRSLFLVSVGTLILGCGKSSQLVEPPDTRALVFDLTVSDPEGSRDRPVTIHASVRNEGTASLYRLQGGGLCDGLKIDITGPDGKVVMVTDPCGPVPIGLCAPPGEMPAAPQQVTLPFTGDTYRRLGPDLGCERVDAPTATYTASVGFRVYWSAAEPPETHQRTVTFHWTGP